LIGGYFKVGVIFFVIMMLTHKVIHTIAKIDVMISLLPVDNIRAPSFTSQPFVILLGRGMGGK
jgi:hypothetical protein